MMHGQKYIKLGARLHNLFSRRGFVHLWRSLTCFNMNMFRSPANYSKTLDCPSRFDVCFSSSQSFPFTVAQSKLVFQPKSSKPVAILKSLPSAAL